MRGWRRLCVRGGLERHIGLEVENQAGARALDFERLC
eukprot:SAG11_NODE_1517_length_4764_cov_7.382637_4_plen_37_part_00